MKWYVVQLAIEPPSWLASAWQADTIWGHLCWGLYYRDGEQALQDFIDAYSHGCPPLLVSNGFPRDLLPCPIVPDSPINENQSIARQREEFRDRKEAKKVRLLTLEEFNRKVNGEQFLPEGQKPDGKMVTTITLKNQVNRLTDTTGGDEDQGGRLFSFKQYHGDSVSIYLKVADNYVEKARELFQYLELSGYGKRKSVGYGQVRILNYKEFTEFSSPANANGFISLSNFVPAADNPTSGYWEVLVKYGKLGEDLANSENPFKKPLIMFSAGSCFYDEPCKEYYGRLVPNLTSIPKVVQYGFALPLPIKLPESQ